MDQGVAEKLAALLNVAAVLDGMREDHGDDLEVLRLRFSVPRAQ